MVTIWHLDGAVAVVLLAAFAYDQFAWLNRKADELENVVFTGWAHYNDYGDPATWVQHGLVAGAIASAWGALGVLLGETFAVGFLHGATIALGFYFVRECSQAWEQYREGGLRGPFVDRRTRQSYQNGLHTGWAIDGTCDLIGPALIYSLARLVGH